MAADKVAIVTGAGSGIDKATAVALLKAGWNTVFAGRRKTLLDDGVASEEELTKLDTDIRQRVSESAEFAQKSPEPAPGELWTDILIEA